jgi:hypothetical protein
MWNKTYKINDSKAISETIDGETIIINLETGYYYSVNRSATIIWNEFQEGNSPENILKYLLDHYEAEKEIVEKSVTDIIRQLLKDDLVLELDSYISVNTMNGSVTVAKGPFLIPQIERYDDMSRALQSDPIHDVKEGGWPNLK